jgi:hypothetical protein
MQHAVPDVLKDNSVFTCRLNSLSRLPDPEDEGTTTLQNVKNCATSTRASYHK